MRIALRADGGRDVGLGHLGRCAALAQAFKASGHRPVFIDLPKECRPWIEARGFKCVSGRGRWDILVADSYRFTKAALAKMRRQARALLVLDDRGDFDGSCDWVLNGQSYAGGLSFAANHGSGLLLGPKFMLLRSEYWRPAKKRTVSTRCARVLVTLGGGRARGFTETVLETVFSALPGVRVDAAIGPLGDAPPARPGLKIHRSPKSLRPLLEACDLIVCAGGQTPYEAAFAGTPAVTLELGPDQTLNVRGLAQAGALVSIGKPGAGWKRRLSVALKRLDASPSKRAAMARAGQALVDGQGARRVARILLGK